MCNGELHRVNNLLILSRLNCKIEIIKFKKCGYPNQTWPDNSRTRYRTIGHLEIWDTRTLSEWLQVSGWYQANVQRASAIEHMLTQ